MAWDVGASPTHLARLMPPFQRCRSYPTGKRPPACRAAACVPRARGARLAPGYMDIRRAAVLALRFAVRHNNSAQLVCCDLSVKSLEYTRVAGVLLGCSMEQTAKWVSVAAAAEALGVTQQAIRNRITRGTLENKRNNRNQIVVLVGLSNPSTQPAPTQAEQHPKPVLFGTVERPIPDETTPKPDAALAGVRLQAAHAAHIASLEKQIDAAANQFEREISRLQAAHQGELERLEAAHRREVDALKNSMETAMTRLTRLMVSSRDRPSIWRRLFG